MTAGPLSAHSPLYPAPRIRPGTLNAQEIRLGEGIKKGLEITGRSESSIQGSLLKGDRLLRAKESKPVCHSQEVMYPPGTQPSAGTGFCANVIPLRPQQEHCALQKAGRRSSSDQSQATCDVRANLGDQCGDILMRAFRAKISECTLRNTTLPPSVGHS